MENNQPPSDPLHLAFNALKRDARSGNLKEKFMARSVIIAAVLYTYSCLPDNNNEREASWNNQTSNSMAPTLQK